MNFIFKYITSRFSLLLRGIQRFIAALGLFVSVALAGASVAGSFFVPTKSLGVLLAAVGCFAAGWIFAVFLRKTVGCGSKESDATMDLNTARSEISRLEKANTELHTENERLAKQRIDINTFEPILKLGLMEADMSIKDVKLAWVPKDFEDEGTFSSATGSQYVGVLEKSFKATYGIDLAKLRVHDDGNHIRVLGISHSVLGFKDFKSTWLLRQLQKYKLKATDETSGMLTLADDKTGFKVGDKYYEIDREKPFEGKVDLNLMALFCEEQEKKLDERIYNGRGEEFHLANVYIKKMAEGFVRGLLAPTKKQIDFVSPPPARIENDADWLTLWDYAKSYNRQIDMPVQIPAEATTIMGDSQTVSQAQED